jgi:prolyl oligopeptidase
MGTDESEDIMILDFPDRPRDSVGASITEDGNFMVIHTSDNCGISNRLYYYDLSAVGHKIDGRIDVKPLFTDNKNIYEVGLIVLVIIIRFSLSLMLERTKR